MKRKYIIKGEISLEDVRRVLRVHYVLATDPAIEAELAEIATTFAAIGKRKVKDFDAEGFLVGCGVGDTLERLMVKPERGAK